MEEYLIKPNTAAQSEELHRRLKQFNQPFFGSHRDYSLHIEIDGAMAAGIVAASTFSTLEVEYLFVEEEFRGRGLGARLLREAESRAARDGVRYVLLNTYSFQAPEFYRAQGYRQLFQVSPCLGPYSQYLFWKELDSMSDVLTLVRPSARYADQVMACRAEMLENGDGFDGCAGLRKAESFERWVWGHQHPKNGNLPSDVWLAIREKDDRLVGIMDFRPQLSEFLLKYGGSIGYSVRPSERKKGYGTEILRLLLPKCKAAGNDRVLLTCDKENEASRRVILKNGGILENEVPDEEGLLGAEGLGTIQRYWIQL